MAGEIFITQKCRKCLGVGVVPEAIGGDTGDICDICHGDGTTTWDSIDFEDVFDKFNDILDKCVDILGKCDDILEACEQNGQGGQGGQGGQ